MNGEEFDDLIDELPWHLKNKVLLHNRDDEELEPPPSGRQNWLQNTTRLERMLWWALIPVVYTWAMVALVAGIVLLIIPPAGLGVIGLAGYPGAMHIAWRLKRSQEILEENP